MSTQIKDMLKVNNKSVALSVNDVEADENGNIILPEVADTKVMTDYLTVDENTKGYIITTLNDGENEVGTGKIDPAIYVTYSGTEPTLRCNAFRGRLRGTATYAISDENNNHFLTTYVRNNEDANINGTVSANSFITGSGIEIL